MSERWELPPVELSPGEELAWKHAVVKQYLSEAMANGWQDGRKSMQAERDAAIARAEAAEAALLAARDAIVGLRPHVPLSYALPVDGVTTSVPSLKAAWAAADTVLATIDALALAGKEPSDG